MLRHMTARQMRGWLAYAQMEPWGEERGDLRAGIVAATMANIHRRRGKRYVPQDFMPRFEPRAPRVQTKEQVLATLFAVAKAQNARAKK